MPKPRTSQLASLRTFLRSFSSSSRESRFPLSKISSFNSSSQPPPPQPPSQQLHHHHLFTHLTTKNRSWARPFSPFSISSRPISSESGRLLKEEESESFAKSLSDELIKNPEAESLSLSQRLDLSFSHVKITPSIVASALNIVASTVDGSSDEILPGVRSVVLDFLKWVSSRPGFDVDDELLSYFVIYFGRRRDFKAAYEVLVHGVGKTGKKCFESIVDRLVRAGRPREVVELFNIMEKKYGWTRDKDSLKFIVSKLCDYGFAKPAEKMVKSLANEFFPDNYICDALIKGWCVDEKLDEVKRVAGEMYRGGFELGTGAYNAILDCVCRLCRRKDPFLLLPEAEKVLVQMEEMGVPRDVETFNVLISHLCKIRKTTDAVSLFHRMGEWGCYPNKTTFLLLIRSLYQAARVGEGDEFIDRMKSAGYGDALNRKEYYGFLKILCGIERIDHAMSIFAMMKEDGREPGVMTYDLLIGKLFAHGRSDKANALYKEAESNGLPIEQKTYKLDPRFAKKKPIAVKKEKKRETLPEKMARKRTRLKKIRLSYVKKPKRTMRAM
ncbi:OLC1v1012072C1 [Oldenlandia corymbosa var. corymbosa]|uniref:OLC1v1012072C1 n=1 Tax=Oldenlandia corymbosa var. corymbosa TaxID=529605 RepID=A0AAV1DY47_OLDCO|nr:OLC1v1012072C1 [Oldenlandia corymbosa var. corymbosa]